MAMPHLPLPYSSRFVSATCGKMADAIDPTPPTQTGGKAKSKSSRTHEKRPVQGTPRMQEHTFLTDRTDVKQMEKGLLDLMDDFNNGRLYAFGKDCTLEKMNKVRERQESLAQLHFDLDSLDNMDTFGEDDAASSRNKLDDLMKKLETLSSSVQSLHQDSSVASP